MLKDVLKEARAELGLKQEDVASMVNVTKQTYLKWENGTTEPKASQINLLSKALNVSANEICEGRRYSRMSLENFIIQKAVNSDSREIETLRVWEQIPDHAAFLNSLVEPFSDQGLTDKISALEEANS